MDEDVQECQGLGGINIGIKFTPTYIEVTTFSDFLIRTCFADQQVQHECKGKFF